MTYVKGNYGAGEPTGLAYRLDSPPGETDNPRIFWEADPVQQTADQVLATANKPTTERGRCVEWVLELMKNGPVTVEDAERQAEEAGFTARTARQARYELRVNVKGDKRLPKSERYWVRA